jgi:YD repeat-containing protein
VKVLWFAPEGTESASTTEAAPGIMLEYDAAGNVIGIEVPDVRERVTKQRKTGS